MSIVVWMQRAAHQGGLIADDLAAECDLWHCFIMDKCVQRVINKTVCPHVCLLVCLCV